MKKISPKVGEVAKKAAKILTKAVGKGLDVGLKVGVPVVAAFGAAGCESTPAAQPQVFEGSIVKTYDGNNLGGKPGKLIVVDTDGNLGTTADQKHIYLSPEYIKAHPEILNAESVRFGWYPRHEQSGMGAYDYIIIIDGKLVHSR
ncbi:MAG: hypothetical protein LBL52_02145 [Rickettsiales bacterium]|jgi:hypothetical protein|nr:hypothetical protein [Rickettsiales bacterium]